MAAAAGARSRLPGRHQHFLDRRGAHRRADRQAARQCRPRSAEPAGVRPVRLPGAAGDRADRRGVGRRPPAPARRRHRERPGRRGPAAALSLGAHPADGAVPDHRGARPVSAEPATAARARRVPRLAGPAGGDAADQRLSLRHGRRLLGSDAGAAPGGRHRHDRWPGDRGGGRGDPDAGPDGGDGHPVGRLAGHRAGPGPRRGVRLAVDQSRIPAGAANERRGARPGALPDRHGVAVPRVLVTLAPVFCCCCWRVCPAPCGGCTPTRATMRR